MGFETQMGSGQHSLRVVYSSCFVLVPPSTEELLWFLRGQHLVVKFISHRGFPLFSSLLQKCQAEPKSHSIKRKWKREMELLANKPKQFEIFTSKALQYFTSSILARTEFISTALFMLLPLRVLLFKNILKSQLFYCFEISLPRSESLHSFSKQSVFHVEAV